MSNTRRSATGEFNQERYCSAPEFERGLLANVVAQRCSLLRNATDRDLALWLQYHSNQPGGIQALVERFLAFARPLIGTKQMHELGVHQPGRVLNAREVRSIRKMVDKSDPFTAAAMLGRRRDFPANYYDGRFPVSGDTAAFSETIDVESKSEFEGFTTTYWRQETRHHRDARAYPSEYPATAFIDYCSQLLAAELTRELTDFCINPAKDFPSTDRMIGLPDLLPGLREAMIRFKSEMGLQLRIAETRVAKDVDRGLKIARLGRVTMIDGLEQIGKTVAAKAWCERNAGTARYVRVPATNDDIGFFRAIAKALGVSSALSMKGVQMRERVEFVIQSTKLMLVFDNAEYLWPQNNRREALPNRLNWILNALVESGAPVALISSPQFTQDQKIVERKTLWRSERFRRSLTHRIVLPSEIADSDLRALVKHYAPEAQEEGVEAIVEYAATSAQYIRGIEAVCVCARFFATEKGRENITNADIMRALKEGVPPSDKAIANDMQERSTRHARGVKLASEGRMRTDFVEASEAPDRRNERGTDLEVLGVAQG